MDQQKASGCRLFSSRKKANGQWDEPVELPSSINAGNSQTPRIMADNETLIFSSDKLPANKGGMDLYVTKLVNGAWSNPIPLDFTNTAGDDQFVSVAALGRYLLRDVPGSRNNTELVEFLIPPAVKPTSVMKVEGYVKSPANTTVPAYISVVDRTSNKRAYSGRPGADGAYAFYLTEGSVYEFDVDPEQSNWTFFSKSFNLTADKIAQRERVNVTLRQPVANDEIPLEMVALKPDNATLDQAATDELKRLIRVAKGNTQLVFEIQVSMEGYVEDSVQTSPELSEVRLDTLKRQIVAVDTSMTASQDTLIIKKTFHNDRTPAIAQRIMEYLTSQGAAAQQFAYKTAAIPATKPDEKKISVKAVARNK